MPMRICIVIVKTSAKNGSYSENPFELNRKWTYTEKDNVSAENLSERQLFEQKLRQLEETSEKRIRLMQEKFDQLQRELTKGKGRGKKSQPVASPSVTSGSSTRTLRQNLDQIHFDGIGANQARAGTSQASEDSFEILTGSRHSSLRSFTQDSELGATATVYIQKLELILNGKYF